MSDDVKPLETPKEDRRIDYNKVADDIIAMLAERGANMSDARVILGYANDLLVFMPVVHPVRRG